MSIPNRIVTRILESDDVDYNSDEMAAAKAHSNIMFPEPPDTSHLFKASDGDLYDLRKPDWAKGPPIRAGYAYFYRDIDSFAKFKSTWRARFQTNYDVAFITHDGGALCETCVKDNLRTVAHSTFHKIDDGWYVTGAATCHGAGPDDAIEDYHTTCSNCCKNLGELE